AHRRFVGHVHDRDPGAVFAQPRGDGQAECAGPTGDHDGSAGEVERVCGHCFSPFTGPVPHGFSEGFSHRGGAGSPWPRAPGPRSSASISSRVRPLVSGTLTRTKRKLSTQIAV